LDEKTRCVPDKERAALYKARQKSFDNLTHDLRGAFEAR
jgi:hypothetical protein